MVCHSALDKRPVPLEDSCRAVLTVLEKGKNGRVYNIGGGNERKNVDIAREILRRLSLPETMIRFVADRPGHDLRCSLDCAKIVRLGWRPTVSFEQGLQETIDWYVANKRWWQPLTEQT
jgi:dTDP-glucose 4,6-dehydratase